MIKVVAKEDRYGEMMRDLDALCVLDGYASREEAFVADRCQLLVDQEIMQTYECLHFNDDEWNCRIDAWGMKPAIDGSGDDIIVLVISKFFDTSTPSGIALTDLKTYCGKARRFVQNVLTKDDFRLRRLGYDTPISKFADFIYDGRAKNKQVDIICVTNGSINTKSNKLVITENVTPNVTFRTDFFDFARFARIERFAGGKEPVDIDLVNDYGMANGLPALHVDTGSAKIDSYLFVMPGKTLYEIYEQWNERLLEQNPRTFLQFTGKINKGIRGTLQNQPDLFFSYNNGIAAVANSVECDHVSGNITKIGNLQIVNGGQTTASIYNACFKATKDKPVDIDKVFVMVKLSVIGNPEDADKVIPKISEYSNSQNKVAASSFSIRHIYHTTIENYSRSILAPANLDRQESHWYYERVLGQYKNAINLKHTKSEKNKFELENPKDQMFKSVDLAKYVLAFDMKPQIVCLGSQKCYANFAKDYLETDKDGNGVIGPEINEEYFKELCCKALLFKALEKRVSKGLRFVLVPYTISTVIKNLEDNDLALNYKLIWNKQWNNEPLFDLLASYSEVVYRNIADNMPDSIQIVSEWGKKAECRSNVLGIKLDLIPLMEYTVSKASYQAAVKEAKEVAAMDKGIDDQTYVVSKPARYWASLYRWCKDGNLVLSGTEKGILDYAMRIPAKIPSPKQSKVIRNIESRAVKRGFSE